MNIYDYAKSIKINLVLTYRGVMPEARRWRVELEGVALQHLPIWDEGWFGIGSTQEAALADYMGKIRGHYIYVKQTIGITVNTVCYDVPEDLTHK